MNRAPGMGPPDAGEVERRARLIATALGRMGLAAFAPGERDLAVGPALLKRLLGAAKIPVVSANLFDRRGQRLFAADRLVEAAGVKVGIFGVIAGLPDDAALWKSWGLEARDPAAAARAEVASLKARGAALVIALVHVGPLADAKKLLADAPGIDWAVLGHSGMSFETPDAVGPTARMLEAMTMGKQLGRLDLHVVDGQADSFVDRGQRAQVATIRADHQRQIVDLRARLAEGKADAARKYFEGRIAELDKAVARESALLQSLPSEVKGSWFENRILPLDASIADHPAIALLVAAYNQENQRRAAAGKPVGVAYRSAPVAAATPAAHVAAGAGAPAPAPPEDVRYAGTVACGACHQPELEFWRTTKHARALATLQKKHRDQDPTCVGCHVTGYLRPGGTRDLTLATGRLRDVGCEACHGPGLGHITAENKKTSISRQVGQSVCLGCHTPDQTDGEFNYPAFVKAILGPGHGGI